MLFGIIISFISLLLLFYFCIYLNRHTYLVDSTLEGKSYKQIIVLCITILIAFGCMVLINRFIAFFYQVDEFNLWDMFCCFIDPGQVNTPTHADNPFFAAFVTIIGSVLMSGLLISTISNIFERRIENYHNGTVRYRCLRDHHLILGYSESLYPVVQNINYEEYRDYKKNKKHTHTTKEEKEKERKEHEQFISKRKKRTVILSLKDPESIKNYYESLIYNKMSECDFSRFIFYQGNPNAMKELKSVNLHRAKDIYIIHQSNGYSAMKSVDMLYKAIRVLSEMPEIEYRNCYIEIDDLAMLKNIERIIRDKNIPLNILPFNINQCWARGMVGFPFYGSIYPSIHPTEDTPYAGRDLHLVMVGFTEISTFIVLEAAKVCHYRKRKDGREVVTRITIIENDRNYIDFFERKYSHLDDLKHLSINYINASPISYHMAQNDILRPGQERIVFFICTRSSEDNILLATSISEETACLPAPVSIFCRLKYQSSIKEQSAEEDSYEITDFELYNLRHDNIYTFGARNSSLPLNMAAEATSDITGMYYYLSLHPNLDMPLKLVRETKSFMQNGSEKWASKYTSEEKRWINNHMDLLTVIKQQFPYSDKPWNDKRYRLEINTIIRRSTEAYQNIYGEVPDLAVNYNILNKIYLNFMGVSSKPTETSDH